MTDRHATRLLGLGMVLLLGATATTARADDDRRAPGPPEDLQVAGGEDWRRSSTFTVKWRNPEHRRRIEVADYRLCRADQQRGCEQGRRRTGDVTDLELTVPEPGDYTLTVTLGDSDGRSDSSNHSKVVHLRFDDQPPTSDGLEAGANGDPAVLSLDIEDGLSGPAGAEIQLRGSGADWKSLTTTYQPGGAATARIADLDLPEGTYDVRALVKDLAGNVGVIDQAKGGETMRVKLPVRSRNAIEATGHVTRTVRRCGPRYVVVRGRRVRRTTCATVTERKTLTFPGKAPLQLANGDRVVITGTLNGVSGDSGIIDVVERARTPGLRPRTTRVQPDSSGRFTIALQPGPSRTIELAYPGNEDNLPASIQAAVLVPATGTLAVDRRLVRNGASVVFSGRLLGEPIPDQGRTIDLQAYYRGAWRTFATPRTDQRGGWRHVYRFGATRGRVPYRFRALIKREAGYPFETGVSRTVIVTVRGS